jgi:hypothetical protein
MSSPSGTGSTSTTTTTSGSSPTSSSSSSGGTTTTPPAPLIPPVQGAPGEEMITLTARGYLTVAGMTIQAGQQFQLPLRAGLGLIGTGEADEVPA